MPALKPTEHRGTIVWLGRVPDRETPEITTVGMTEMPLGFAGIEGSIHGGLTRASCSRVTRQYPKGTEIRNVRQLSVVSAEELETIAARLDLASIEPRWLGASIVVSGIPDFSHLPPSSRLQSESGCTITVDMQNRPCHFPGLSIDKDFEGAGKGFKAAAEGLRGVTAWVEREGVLRMGDVLTLHIPDQRPWTGGA